LAQWKADSSPFGTTDIHQIRSLVLCVDLVGSRWIWPAHVGRVVGPDGSSRVLSDRLDDQSDDQRRDAESSAAVQTTEPSVQQASVIGSRRVD
jgi:hypothetical protein